MSDINELRECLFATLRGLQDKDQPMDIERAKAVSDVAQTIINSVKVEVDHMKITGSHGSGFIPAPTPRLVSPKPEDGTSQTATGVKTVNGNVTTHRLK